MIRRGGGAVLLFAAMVAATVGLWRMTPGSLVPEEDQGFYIVAVILPDGATLQRTDKVVSKVIQVIKSNPNNEDVVAFNPPPIFGLATAGGFELYLQNRGEGGAARMGQVLQQFLGAANSDKRLGGVQTLWRAQVPQLYVDVDREKAKALGVRLEELYGARARPPTPRTAAGGASMAMSNWTGSSTKRSRATPIWRKPSRAWTKPARSSARPRRRCCPRSTGTCAASEAAQVAKSWYSRRARSTNRSRSPSARSRCANPRSHCR